MSENTYDPDLIETRPIRLGAPEVTDLLRTIVAEKGPDYIYPGHETDCTYVEDDEAGNPAPSCLIGHLLVRAGVPIEEVHKREGGAADEVLENLERGGLIVLPEDPIGKATLLRAATEAQEAQDAGDSWGTALTAYEHRMGDPLSHPLDCLFCNAGESMNHLYEPPAERAEAERAAAECDSGCSITEPYGFVIAAGCPVHETQEKALAGEPRSTDDEDATSLLDRLAAAFKKAWHEADERGEAGHRTKYGIAAVLAEMGGTLPPALWVIPEPKPTPAEAKVYVFEPRATFRDWDFSNIGQRIVRMEPLAENLYDRDEVGPMYAAHFEDGTTIHVFEDEVQDRTGQVAQEKVLAGEPTSPDPYAHPDDCLFCRAGEPMNHLYEPPAKD